jgi:hypothetical protein
MPETQEFADQQHHQYNATRKPAVLPHQSRPVRVQLPAEPPHLNPQAARALLDLLLDAKAASATADPPEEA